MLTDEQPIDDAPLTSPALQLSHPGAYRHLFERCSTVLSAPLAMSLTGDRSLSSREASIVIQLPRRVWVGLEDAPGTSVRLGSFMQYDVLSERFSDAQAHDRQAFERVLPPLQLQLEQHLASPRMSTHSPPNALRFTRYGCDGTATVLRSRNDGIPEGLDVVVDTERERVYVANLEVNSRELWSQRTTCEVLRRLLPAPETMVSSTELPRSSYRSSCSEMASKVLTPLTKLVATRTGNSCTFVTRGSIDRYTICADIRTLSVGVLEPCFPPTRT